MRFLRRDAVLVTDLIADAEPDRNARRDAEHSSHHSHRCCELLAIPLFHLREEIDEILEAVMQRDVLVVGERAQIVLQSERLLVRRRLVSRDLLRERTDNTGDARKLQVVAERASFVVAERLVEVRRVDIRHAGYHLIARADRQAAQVRNHERARLALYLDVIDVRDRDRIVGGRDPGAGERLDLDVLLDELRRQLGLVRGDRDRPDRFGGARIALRPDLAVVVIQRRQPHVHRA